MHLVLKFRNLELIKYGKTRADRRIHGGSRITAGKALQFPPVVGPQRLQQDADRGDAAGTDAGEPVKGTFRICRRAGVGAAAGAVLHDVPQILEDTDDRLRIHMGQAEATDTGGIDDPAGVRRVLAFPAG